MIQYKKSHGGLLACNLSLKDMMTVVIFTCKENLNFLSWNAGVPALDLGSLHLHSCYDRDLQTLQQKKQVKKVWPYSIISSLD